MSQIIWEKSSPERDPGIYKGGSRYLVNGKVCAWDGPKFDVFSPVYEGEKPRQLGSCGLLDRAVAMEALKAAVKAYDKGRGDWPTAPVSQRIDCMEKFLTKMKGSRSIVSQLLTWEIAKAWQDSVAEFDRTVQYGLETIEALKDLDRGSSGFARSGGFYAQIRRSPYGVALCMGPYNYPLNETFATLLPTLIMGNTVIVKLPRLGMLCNMPLLEAFAESFPPGVINIISGEGSTVVTPIIESGEVDLLAFIGSAGVANILKQTHPRPNRLRSVLGLGAKNAAIVFSDVDVDAAAKECVSGALSFNGQRCTALKIIFVQKSIAEAFVEKVVKHVDGLKAAMPYVDGAQLTPLPEKGAVDKMRKFVEDAVSKGSKVVNNGGGKADKTYFHPAVLYPVNDTMEVWHKEQFGPVVPIATFEDPAEVLDYLAKSPYGQQASVFGTNPAKVGPLVDALVNQVGRVNLNGQCRRGPDTYPFNGRKDSAEGTLSVSDALRVFSIRTLVAAKQTPENVKLTQKIIETRASRFLSTDYLF